MRRSARTVAGDFFKTLAFLAAANLKPFVERYLASSSTTPIVYMAAGGGRGYGYEARLLPQVCQVYIAACQDEKLTHKQEQIADACVILRNAVAQVAIDALVDEATGFLYSRARDALQKLLEQYVSKELARWERAFEIDFYKHLHRLKGWPFDPSSTKRSHAVARLTVNLTYDRIHPELLKELKQVRVEKGKPSHKLHRWLTTFPNGGHPRLKQHLEGITALMSVAKTWDQFKDWIDQRYPELNKTMRILFPHPDDDPEGEPAVE